MIWLHHLDFNENVWKKARWELHKDAAYCFKQIMESTPNKTVVVGLHRSHLAYHQIRLTRHVGHGWRIKR